MKTARSGVNALEFFTVAGKISGYLNTTSEKGGFQVKRGVQPRSPLVISRDFLLSNHRDHGGLELQTCES